ncbi:hypothetical protein WMY93_004017 [Mugilogobius chulae]|uniref:Uncharacterized protein n=1 Tax=Mugilogobius chulae TaxID=88201 RepID=A0AAW0PQX0_9GOBI
MQDDAELDDEERAMVEDLRRVYFVYNSKSRQQDLSEAVKEQEEETQGEAFPVDKSPFLPIFVMKCARTLLRCYCLFKFRFYSVASVTRKLQLSTRSSAQSASCLEKSRKATANEESPALMMVRESN